MSLRPWVYAGVAVLGVTVAGAWALVGWLSREPPNYTRIEEGLYVGGIVAEPPPGTQAVLNLCEFADDYQVEVSSHQPIPDAAPAPSIDWLRKQVAFLEANRRAGRPIYLHCAHGCSRSGMVAVAWFMFRNKWTHAEALRYVQSQRPEVRPNPVFNDLLAEWESRQF